MKNMNDLICDYCGAELKPIWFIEEEIDKIDHMEIKTGRKRKAVDYLICPECGDRIIVDSEFMAGNWYFSK